MSWQTKSWIMDKPMPDLNDGESVEMKGSGARDDITSTSD
jgi:hypothetical protein